MRTNLLGFYAGILGLARLSLYVRYGGHDFVSFSQLSRL